MKATEVSTKLLDDAGKADRNESLRKVAAWVEGVDVRVGAKMAKHRRTRWARAAGALGAITDQEPLYLTGVVLCGAGWMTKRPILREAGESVLLAVALADVIKSLLKRMVTRSRPNAVLDEKVEYERRLGKPPEKERQSFPSGHVAGSIAAARAICPILPTAGPCAAGVSVALALTRVIKGAHWPLDLAAGLLVGWISGGLARGVLRMGAPDKQGGVRFLF